MMINEGKSIFDNSYLMFSGNRGCLEKYKNLAQEEKITFLEISMKRQLKNNVCRESSISTEERDLCNLCNVLQDIGSQFINEEIAKLK